MRSGQRLETYRPVSSHNLGQPMSYHKPRVRDRNPLAKPGSSSLLIALATRDCRDGRRSRERRRHSEVYSR